jgi:ribonuclease Z
LPFDVTILGSNSAIPMYGRHHTAQFLRIQNHHFLIDCGEATQLQLQRYGLKSQRLEAIFISHLHGDHYLGLVGLLSSLHLMGRTKELYLFAPPALQEIITLQLKHSDTVFRYNLKFHALDMQKGASIYETNRLAVSTIPLQHRIPCVGFIIKEKPYPFRIRRAKLPENIRITEIAQLKQGKDVLHSDGKVKYSCKEYTLPPKRSRSYAYCSDTLYLPELSNAVKEVDLLYHEATFLNEKELNATNTFHATAGQAATVARDAKVKKLIIGHFSARYKDLAPLETEARKIFKNSFLAKEGKVFSITN